MTSPRARSAPGDTEPDDVIAAALQACATEPIHIPGAIQPHGMLLVLSEADLTVLQVSRNVAERFPALHAGGAVHALHPDLEAAIWLALETGDMARPFLAGSLDLGGEHHDLLVHRSEQAIIVELEPSLDEHRSSFAALHPLIRGYVARLQRAEALSDLCALAAEEMRRVTGFGRTLVYRFDEHGHGEVLAESRAPEYESYLGHRFPASDIPPQARDLYRRSHVRLIPDATYEPSPLVPALRPDTGRPTDLSHAALRSVSPVHVEYMRNMGTLASMSVSLMVRGQLWGLISCHHRTPRYLPHALRAASEHLGQILALQLESKESFEDAEYGLELRRTLVSVVATTVEAGNSLAALAHASDDLLRLTGSTGAAIVLGDDVTCIGDTPTADDVRPLAEWLAMQGHEVFATERLRDAWPDAERYADVASGVIAISVSQIHRHVVMWFRPEVVRTVLWAGDPTKPTVREPGARPRLHPRRSFSTWREELRGRSTRWRPEEVSVARELRHALLNIVLRRAEEVAALANELGRINKELEAFSYSVSHDLRAPLRHITGYADLVRDYEGAAISERGQRYLGHIKEAAKFAGTLVDDLLAFSQMGRTVLRPKQLDLNELVKGILYNMRIDGSAPSVEWEVGPLPTVVADPVFMQVALQNLIGNAVKYSARRTPPRIAITSEDLGERVAIRVRDNGVGFDMKYVGKLFGVFQRLHRVEEFPGTGIGLASVRRAVERHGGTVEAAGELDKGATFTMIMPKTLPAGLAPPQGGAGMDR